MGVNFHPNAIYTKQLQLIVRKSSNAAIRMRFFVERKPNGSDEARKTAVAEGLLEGCSTRCFRVCCAQLGMNINVARV